MLPQGPNAMLPLPPPPRLQAAAWVVPWNPDSLASFEANAPWLDEAMLGLYSVEADGSAARAKLAEGTLPRFLAAARAAGTRLYGMAANYAPATATTPEGFDAARMSLLLNDPARRAGHVAALARMAAEDGLAGVDLDYESLAAGDRDAFSRLVRELAAALHRKGLRLSVTVHAKTDAKGGWSGPEAQDTAAIGRAADAVRVMAYDLSWSGSGAGPIAPDEWVRRVAAYARTQIPARKLSLGVPAYGYDWGAKPAASLRWREWTGAARPSSAPDPASGELVAGDARFAGAASLARKLGIARALGLAGVSLWYCGSEDPGIWTLLPPRR